MEKCTLCGRKKAPRECPALGGKLCSACCGTQRQNAVRCPEGCEILKGSAEYRLAREVRTEITDRIGDDFRTEKDEILDRPAVGEFARALELSFIRDFYRDESVKDGDIRSALERLYACRTGKIASLVVRNRTEELVFAAWEKADRGCRDLSEHIKTDVIVRIVKSIREGSGGPRGDHGYLDMLHYDFGLEWPAPFDEDCETDQDGRESEGGDLNNGPDGEESAREDLAPRDIASLNVASFAGMTAIVKAWAEAEEPEEARIARHMFRKEFGWLAKLAGRAWSDPVMEGEFALWFCTEYDYMGCGAPAELFWQEFWHHLSKATRAMANALRRSIWSTFTVTGRDGSEYRLANCRTGYEHLVRTVDFSSSMEKGDVVVARIAWNPEKNDRSYCFLGLVLPMEKEAAEVTGNRAASEKEETARWRGAFLERFSRADPVFQNGEEAHRAFSDFRDGFLGNKAGGKRHNGDSGFPTKRELWEMTVGPWEDLISELRPVAMMFESDGLHASAIYPRLLQALDGSGGDDAVAREAVRRAVEDEDEIPLAGLRRLLEEHQDRAVRLLSMVRPQIKRFEDLKRLVERRRAEPFDLMPAVDMDMCSPPGDMD